MRQVLFSTVGAIGIAAMAVAVPTSAGAQQAAVQIDNDDIGGVVTDAKWASSVLKKRFFVMVIT